MTIDSYRYAFMLFLTFMEEQKVPADEVEISDLSHQNVLKYLSWLQSQRGNSISTRNHRQAVINSFVKYLMYEFPDYLSEFQAILSIPVKKAPQKEISYLKTDGVKLLFDQIDINSKSGIRDYAILTILYTTGIRVSELIQIRVKDVSLQKPPTLLVHGKGQKSRFVPLTKQAVDVINKYINSYNLAKNSNLQDWLFKNHLSEQFKRQGINYIIKKYADISRSKNSDLIPKNFSPHNMRHTVAMELVDSGVDLIYIRDLLGHVSVKTTEVYAKADTAKKREAIEAASKEIVPMEEAQWEQNGNLKDWLKNFNRR
jgi:site-specific recombinase XerD